LATAAAAGGGGGVRAGGASHEAQAAASRRSSVASGAGRSPTPQPGESDAHAAISRRLSLEVKASDLGAKKRELVQSSLRSPIALRSVVKRALESSRAATAEAAAAPEAPAAAPAATAAAGARAESAASGSASMFEVVQRVMASQLARQALSAPGMTEARLAQALTSEPARKAPARAAAAAAAAGVSAAISFVDVRGERVPRLPAGHELLAPENDPDYQPPLRDVLLYAELLGLDTAVDFDLLWVAREALRTPVPPPWRVCRGLGAVYFVNCASGECRFLDPCDAHYAATLEREKRRKLARTVCARTGEGMRRWELGRQLLDNAKLEFVASRLAVAKDVSFLDLSGNLFGDTGVEKLARVLARNACVRHLDLSSNSGLTVLSMDSLGQALESNIALTALDLSFNGLNDIAVARLAASLGRNKTLRALDLSNNRLTDQSVHALVNALHGSRIERLFIGTDSHRFSPASVSLLASVLQRNRERNIIEQMRGALGRASPAPAACDPLAPATLSPSPSPSPSPAPAPSPSRASPPSPSRSPSPSPSSAPTALPPLASPSAGAQQKQAAAGSPPQPQQQQQQQPELASPAPRRRPPELQARVVDLSTSSATPAASPPEEVQAPPPSPSSGAPRRTSQRQSLELPPPRSLSRASAALPPLPPRASAVSPTASEQRSRATDPGPAKPLDEAEDAARRAQASLAHALSSVRLSARTTRGGTPSSSSPPPSEPPSPAADVSDLASSAAAKLTLRPRGDGGDSEGRALRCRPSRLSATSTSSAPQEPDSAAAADAAELEYDAQAVERSREAAELMEALRRASAAASGGDEEAAAATAAPREAVSRERTVGELVAREEARAAMEASLLARAAGKAPAAAVAAGDGDIEGDDSGESDPAPWRLGGELGRDPHGVVRLGMLRATGELVAVKILRGEDEEATAAAAEALQREAPALAQVRHPNLVALRSVEWRRGRVCLVADYVSGYSLHDVIERFGALSEPVMRSYAAQLTAALAHCHARGVAHRSLSSRNVLVDSQGGVRLGDLGSAALSAATALRLDLADARHTLPWTAPELLCADAAPDAQSRGPKADVWSLGCVLVEMATGRAPWAEARLDSAFRTLHHIVFSQAVPSLGDRELSPAAADFLSHCLQRDVAKRAEARQLAAHEWLRADASEQPSPQPPHLGAQRM
jgi:hypothetical protein